MNCFDLPHGLAHCITVAKPWFELFVGFLGVGTFTLAAVLIWIIKKIRAENERAEKAYDEALLDKQRAEQALRDTNRELGALKYQLDLCQSAKSGEANEMAEMLEGALRENERLQSRFSLVRKMTTHGDAEFWSREPQSDQRLDHYESRLGNSIPILMMAAQKGGVGKSTLATNLAACFADSGERVLVVDMDYQGTTSAQMMRQRELRLGVDQSRVDQLLQDQLRPHWQNAILHVNDNLHFLPAFYGLEAVERREEYRWVLGDTPDDVRYRLARAILDDYVKATYTLVVIDAPPRMTLGFINALCTSTHLFVPTIVDNPSALAVGRFAQQFSRLVPKVNPFLRFAGIIGTMTNRGPELPKVNKQVADLAEAQASAELEASVAHLPLFIREAVMQRDTPLATAASSGIAYWKEPSTQPIFKEIAKAIRSRMDRKMS
jgi:cellulose biosynthesis protein BcsQ